MFSTLYKHLNAISVLLLLMSGMMFAGLSLVNAADDEEQTDEEVEAYCDLYQYNTEQIVEDIFEEVGIASNIEFGGLFGGTSKKPKVENLYLNVYKTMKSLPRRDAMMATADKWQYTETEMCSILGGNLFMLAKSQDTALTQADALELLEDMKADYQHELEKANTTQQMLIEVYPKEIFANGDTGDSGFDVLYDLEILECLLFAECEAESIGGGNFPTTTRPSSAIGGGGGSDDEDEEEADETSTDSSSSGSSGSSGTDGEVSDEVEDEEEAFDENACAVDDELQEALEAPAADEVADAEDADADAEDADADDEDPDDADDGSDTDDSDDDSSGDDDLPEAASNWEDPNPSLCGDVFCLVIRLTNNEDPTYLEEDNCVKCHVDFIVKAFEDTNSTSLNPSKVSGNLMEPSLCKRSLLQGGINISFIPIKVPIQTPSSSSLVTGANFSDMIGDFKKEVMNADVDEAEQDEDYFDGYAARRFDEIKKEVKTALPENLTYEDLFNEAMSAYEDELNEITDEFEHSKSRSQLKTEGDLFTAYQDENTQMIIFFSSYRSLVGLTNEVATALQQNLKTVE